MTTCSLAGADGVIVGSAIVDIVEKNLGNTAAMEIKSPEYVSEMKKTGRAVKPGFFGQGNTLRIIF